MRALNSERRVFCDFQLVGQLQALVCAWLKWRWVAWAMAGCLCFYGTYKYSPFHIPQTRSTSLASDNEEKNHHPPAPELDTWSPIWHEHQPVVDVGQIAGAMRRDVKIGWSNAFISVWESNPVFVRTVSFTIYMVGTRTATIRTESWMWEGWCGLEGKVFCDCQLIGSCRFSCA